MTKSCERAEELVSVLYGEASERETREFELHLQQCGSCRAEFASFSQVRQSVGEWRDEILGGFVSSPVVIAPQRKSAMAALRQFFDLSPLWMKGAVGFAVVAFCVLAALAFVKFNFEKPKPLTATNPGKIYTQEDMNRIIKEELAKRESTQQRVEPKPIVVEQRSPVKNSGGANSSRASASRRPFSKAERDQLAAELRLLTAREADFGLLGDRINDNQK